jgi:dTDP-4-dehydrorhamnose 3,5-epimerase
MEIRELSLPGVFEIIPRKFADDRGFFSETFSNSMMVKHDLPTQWVQDNQSHSKQQYVLRGLHYQTPPKAQDKLVRVVRGSILDVAVDIRVGSPYFGKWVSLVVSAAAWNQILVPKGFAHGFLTLEPETEVIYKVSEFYAPECDRGILWSDPAIAIDWPLEGHQPVLSAKDLLAKPLLEQDTGFKFGGIGL